MNELRDRKVAQHNDLITSVAKMDKIPLKIFELAVSYVNTENPPQDNIIYLSKKELFTFFDVTDSNKHSRFKEAIEKMQKQAFFQIKEEKNNGFKFKSIVPIPFVEWNDYNDEVKIRFDVDIMPYIIDLKKNFTQYAITDIMDLESKYSIILYKWLSMNYNQFENYQFKSNRTQKQLEDYQNPKISVKSLRILTDTESEYSRFGNFESYIIKNSLKELNKKTHFIVSYDKIKKGRTISEIQFHISKKQIVKNEFYKEEQKDFAFLKAKEERQSRQQALFTEAMQSQYTKLLGEKWLINLEDMQNIMTMTDLHETVYPLYDELKELRGINGVKDHLSYVRAKQEDYSKRNVVKYLKIAIEQYLSTIKR